MRPDDRAVDHVGARVPFDHLGERLQHGVEHSGRHPATIPPEHAVPLAVLVGQVPPQRPRPRHPDHALEIAPVVASRTASSTALSRKQRPDQCPLVLRYSNPLAQRRHHKTALNKTKSLDRTSVWKGKSGSVMRNLDGARTI